MDINSVENRLSGILPEHGHDLTSGLTGAPTREERVKEAARAAVAKQDAKELARVKFAEKQRLRRLEEGIGKAATEYGMDPEELAADPEVTTPAKARAVAEQRKRLAAAEEIEAISLSAAEPLDVRNVAAKAEAAGVPVGKGLLSEALRLQGASRPEMAKLLAALNINLSVQLTKSDTRNLLACLLTCNEGQLQALLANKKVPIAVKAVIKRLLEDAKLGNIDVVEKLWDRIFGKGQMALDLPEGAQLQAGIIPNSPVSREAYLIIRESLINGN